MSDPSIPTTAPARLRNRDKKNPQPDTTPKTNPKQDSTTPKPEERGDQVRATVSQALRSPEFTTGLKYGAVAVAVGLVIAFVWHQVRKRPAPIAGIVFGAGAILALRDAVGVPDGLLVALAMLAGGTALAEMLRLPPALELAAAVPGAILVTREIPQPTEGWVSGLLVLTIVLGGAAAGSFDHRWRRRGIGPVVAAITILGIYVCVPETKRVLVLLGVALPLPLMGWPFAVASLGRAGSYTFVAVALWAAAFDGATRSSAIIGSVASLGLLVAEPAMRAIAGRRGPLELIPDRIPAWLWVAPVALIHLAIVFVSSRVAGLRATTGEALSVVAAEAIALVCVSLGLRFWAPPPLPKVRTRPRRPSG